MRRKSLSVLAAVFFHLRCFFNSTQSREKFLNFSTFLHKNNELKRMGTNTPEFGFGQDEDDDDDDDVWANVDAR